MLLGKAGIAEVTIDLENRTLSDSRTSIRPSFPLDGFARHCLLEGVDQLEFLLQASTIGARSSRSLSFQRRRETIENANLTLPPVPLVKVFGQQRHNLRLKPWRMLVPEGTIVRRKLPSRRFSERRALDQYYRRVRSESEALAANITPEEAQIQSMPDVSPTKWHLAHTSWFFETFHCLDEIPKRIRITLNDAFKVLFNSYYNAVGEQHPRPQARFGVAAVARRGPRLSARHRRASVRRWLDGVDHQARPSMECVPIMRVVGLHHEQQHQELMLTDILARLLVQPSSASGVSCPMQPRAASDVAEPITVALVTRKDFTRSATKVLGIRFRQRVSAALRQFVHGFELASRL